MTSSYSVLIGRFLLGLYFLLPGIQKFTDSQRLLAYMESHEIPYAVPLLWLAGIASILGGIMLMTGRHVKLVAYGFVVYVLLVNFMLHDFWTMSGDVVARETQKFVKNLAITAGLLVLAGYAPRRHLSLQGWWWRDSKIAEPETGPA